MPATKSKEQSKKEGPQKGRQIIPKRLLSGVGADLEDIILRGKGFRAVVDMAVESAPITRTIDGASTIELGVHDPRRRLIRHPMFESPREKPVKLELDDLNFLYVKMAKSGKTTTLTFEDQEIHWLRRFRGPKKAFRGRTTRAEFILSLIRAVRRHKIPVVIPELHKTQPLESIKEHNQSESEVDTQAGRAGLGSNDVGQIQVKKTDASLAQIHVIDVVLDTGMSMGVNFKVLVASIMTITQESAATNINIGSAGVGPFSQEPGTWGQDFPGASNDIVECSKGFFMVATREDNANPGQSLSSLCQAVQKSADGSLYAEWEKEAKNTVTTYLGGASVTTTQTTIKPYAFEVKKDEDYWEAIKRLANEVNWRAFFVGGVFFFIAEEDLYRGKVHLQINEESQGIDNIDFDADDGKAVIEMTVTAHAKRWGVPPGMVVRVGGMGPANGRFLVSTMEGSLLPGDGDLVTITLKKPTHSTPEPAPETETNTLGASEGSATGNDAVDAMLAEADRIDGLQSGYQWGGGHGASTSANGPWDCSGAVSRLLDVGGFLTTPVASGPMASMYQSGVGENFTIFANGGHVFVRFGDRYWGTSSENPGGGPGWHSSRDTGGYSARHPGGT